MNNNYAKLVNNINDFKHIDKKNVSIQEKKERKIKSKIKKNVMGKYKTERRNIFKKKPAEKNNENVNNIIKRYQKYGRLLSSSKDNIVFSFSPSINILETNLLLLCSNLNSGMKSIFSI